MTKPLLGICDYPFCKKQTVIHKCRYCKSSFCQDHLLAKVPNRNEVNAVSWEDKFELADRNVKSGHICAAYYAHHKQKVEQESEAYSKSLDALSGKRSYYRPKSDNKIVTYPRSSEAASYIAPSGNIELTKFGTTKELATWKLVLIAILVVLVAFVIYANVQSGGISLDLNVISNLSIPLKLPSFANVNPTIAALKNNPDQYSGKNISLSGVYYTTAGYYDIGTLDDGTGKIGVKVDGSRLRNLMGIPPDADLGQLLVSGQAYEFQATVIASGGGVFIDVFGVARKIDVPGVCMPNWITPSNNQIFSWPYEASTYQTCKSICYNAYQVTSVNLDGVRGVQITNCACDVNNCNPA